jgi:sortase B
MRKVLIVAALIVCLFNLNRIKDGVLDYVDGYLAEEDIAVEDSTSEPESAQIVPEETAKASAPKKHCRSAAPEKKAEEAQAPQVNNVLSDNCPKIDADFKELREKNPDFVAVIYVPYAGILEPVVQGNDNSHYLGYSFDRSESSLGSICLDSRNAANWTDLNSFVYGHNMKSGQMFGKLKALLKADYSQPQYVYVYTAPDAAIRYQIYSVDVTTSESRGYSNDVTYSEYVKNAIADSDVNIAAGSEAFQQKAPMITLATCHGQAHGNGKLLVHAVRVD